MAVAGTTRTATPPTTARTDAQLLERLGSWSPVVRERAAMALARRKTPPVPTRSWRCSEPRRCRLAYGACQAVAALRGRAAPAVPTLRRLLAAPDLWLRIKAAEALAQHRRAANAAVPELLALLAHRPGDDPRGMQQRYLTFALFDREHGGLLCDSLDGVDAAALQEAVRAGLRNQDGRARSSLGSVYRTLSTAAIAPLLPAIHRAVIEPAPSGEMFADGIRVEGLRMLAKHRIAEGITACVQYARDQNPWESQIRTPELMAILCSYGQKAKVVLPELRRLADWFEKDEPDFPRDLMLQKAKCVREAIATIEAATTGPELVPLPKQ
jgi:hypothetical protein